MAYGDDWGPLDWGAGCAAVFVLVIVALIFGNLIFFGCIRQGWC